MYSIIKLKAAQECSLLTKFELLRFHQHRAHFYAGFHMFLVLYSTLIFIRERESRFLLFNCATHATDAPTKTLTRVSKNLSVFSDTGRSVVTRDLLIFGQFCALVRVTYFT